MAREPRWYILFKVQTEPNWYPASNIQEVAVENYKRKLVCNDLHLTAELANYKSETYAVLVKAIYPRIPQYPEWMKIQREEYYTYLTKMEGELYEVFYYPRASLVLKRWAKPQDGKELNLDSISLMENGKWHQEIMAYNGITVSKLWRVRDRMLKRLPETLMEYML